MLLKRSLFSLYVVLSICTARDFSFVGETIAVSILNDSTIEVKGDYIFKNSTAMKFETPILYPFPIDSIHQFPHAVSIVQHNASLPYHKGQRGVSFQLKLKAHEQCTTSISYQQKVSETNARYILTTTQYWENPLSDSHYSLSIPSNKTLEYLSYPSDTVSTQNDVTTFYFYKERFLPRRDFIFRWK